MTLTELKEMQVIDIWLEKIRRGWKIEDAPNEELRKELRKRLDKGGK